MSVIEALVLGVVQGLSEFLPVSSSGHLEIVRWLMGWDGLPADTETAFDVAVHLGTLVGAVAYLRRDVPATWRPGWPPFWAGPRSPPTAERPGLWSSQPSRPGWRGWRWPMRSPASTASPRWR